MTFKLLKEKITDVTMTNDIEIQKNNVSSIGGAVSGAILFGALGAIIGGRAKNKKVKSPLKKCLTKSSLPNVVYRLFTLWKMPR